MKEGHAEGLAYMFGVVGWLYMIGNTSNPIGYVAIAFSTWMIYRLLKKEEQREIAKGQ